MIDHDKPRFSAMLAGVMDLYGKALSLPAAGLWWASLQRFSLADVECGFGRYVQDPDQGRYPPTPAGIIGQIEATGNQAGTSAFDRVCQAIRSVGPYETVVFDDPLIHAVVDGLGGWIHICQSWTDEDLKFREREFSTRYQAARKDPALRYPGKLIGIAEAHNSREALLDHAHEPLLIGDHSKATAVLNGGGKGGLELSRPDAVSGGLRRLAIVTSTLEPSA